MFKKYLSKIGRFGWTTEQVSQQEKKHKVKSLVFGTNDVKINE